MLCSVYTRELGGEYIVYEMSELTNGQAVIIWGTKNKGIVCFEDTSVLVRVFFLFVCLFVFFFTGKIPRGLWSSRLHVLDVNGKFSQKEFSPRTYPWVISQKPAQ